jgi:hypothetical protein
MTKERWKEVEDRKQEKGFLAGSQYFLAAAIGFRPALRYPSSNSIPSPVKRIQAPQ